MSFENPENNHYSFIKEGLSEQETASIKQIITEATDDNLEIMKNGTPEEYAHRAKFGEDQIYNNMFQGTEEDRDFLHKLSDTEASKIENYYKDKMKSLSEAIAQIDSYLDGSSGTLDFANFGSLVKDTQELENTYSNIVLHIQDTVGENPEKEQDPRIHALMQQADLLKKFLETEKTKIDSLSSEITPDQERVLLEKREILQKELSTLQELENITTDIAKDPWNKGMPNITNLN